MVVLDPKSSFIFIALTACWLIVANEEAFAERSCSDITTVDMAECNKHRISEAERELSRVYKNSMSQIGSRTNSDPEIRRKWTEALRDAQRAWITFRDRDCGDPIRFEWLNGSGSGAAAARCNLDAIKARIAQLTDRYPDQQSATPSQPLPDPVVRQNTARNEIASKTVGSFSANKCSVKAGDKVVAITPQALSEKLAGLATIKNEFESSRDFQARQKATLQQVQSTFFVAATSSPANINYDADRERFSISKFAWSNISLNFDAVRGLVERPMSVLTDYHGLGLSTSETLIGTYRGSNAYGASTEVSRVRRQTYGIFDRLSRSGESTWRLDFDKDASVPASSLSGGIFFDATRDKAQALKADMRFAVELIPRPPFIARGSRRFEPQFDRPTDIDETTEIFIGKLGCLLVINTSGTVLRTVTSGY